MAESIEGSLRDGMPVARAMIRELRALDVPADVQRDWSGFVDGYDQILSAMPEFAHEQAAGNETDEMRVLFTQAGKKIRPLSERYDLGACAKLSAG